jgi:hypothetical protein
MTNTLWKAPVASLGCDTSGKVTLTQAQALKAKGYSFLIRAVSVPGGSVHPAQLTPAEIADIRSAGLALCVYQMFQTTTLSAQKGTEDGQSAVSQVKLLGFPLGVSIYGDSEGQSNMSPLIEVDYWNAWGDAVTNGGYAAGMYVGPGPKMTGSQIGTNVKSVHGYWQAAAANMPYPSPRGYQLFQLNPSNVVIAGQAFDLNVTQVDFRGGQPVMWAP